MLSAVRPALSARSPRLALLIFSAGLGLAATVFAQNTPDTSGGRRRGGDTTGQGGGGRGNFDPAEMQARMLGSIRERLEVPDDEEWKLISTRVMKVSELRRASGGGMAGGMAFGGRGGPPPGGAGGGGGDRTSSRGTRGGGPPEMELLSSALRDKLPDAEIKMRLDRLREARKANEANLAKAQDELRAVLSVRQEAVAVMFGLLP